RDGVPALRLQGGARAPRAGLGARARRRTLPRRHRRHRRPAGPRGGVDRGGGAGGAHPSGRAQARRRQRRAAAHARSRGRRHAAGRRRARTRHRGGARGGGDRHRDRRRTRLPVLRQRLAHPGPRRRGRDRLRGAQAGQDHVLLPARPTSPRPHALRTPPPKTSLTRTSLPQTNTDRAASRCRRSREDAVAAACPDAPADGSRTHPQPDNAPADPFVRRGIPPMTAPVDDRPEEAAAPAITGPPSRATESTRTLGRLFRLGVRATVLMVVDIARGRFPFREAVVQGWFFVSVSALPAVLVALPLGVVIAVQVGSMTDNVGANSMAGAVGGMGVMQQIAPLAAALLIGGAGGSAISADLASRTIREEIDALRTMGVDPHRRLVAPRILAMIVVAPMLSVLIILMSIVAGFAVAALGQGVAPGSYWMSFGSFAS